MSALRPLAAGAAAAALALATSAGCDTGANSPTRGAQAASPTSVAVEPGAPDAVREATFDDVKFEMEKTDLFREEMLTEKVRGLLGQRIRIRGYMYPTLRKSGLKQFVLVRDNLECCFGPGAALYDCILVSMVPGETTEYSVRPVAVEGAFRLEPLVGPDGRPMAIYQMKGEKVK